MATDVPMSTEWRRAVRVSERGVRTIEGRNDSGGDRGAAAVESQANPGRAKERSVKSYFKKEARFMLMWLLGLPLFLIAVALIAAIVISRQH